MGKTLHLFMLLALFFLTGGSISANAQESAYKTLTFSPETMEKKIQDYTSTWTTTVGTDTWTIVNFNNNNKGWNYIRCGRQKAASVATITNKEAYDQPITKVVVTYDKVSNVNTTYLEVASDANFTSNVQKITIAAQKAGDVEYTVATPTANSYYRLTVDNKKGSNGSVQISKVTYYASSVEPGKTATKVTFEKGDYTVKQDANATDLLSYTNVATVTNADGNPIDGATVTYSSSDKDHADVDANGKVTIDPTIAGTYTITASYDGDDTYATSSAIYTITVQEDLGLTGAGTEADPYTVADALTILNKKKETEFGKSVYVKGTISRVVSTTPHKTYGSLNYDISDDGQDENFLYVFGGLKKDAAQFTSASEIAVGDIVLLKGDLQTYGSKTPELNKDNTLEKFYERPETFDETSTESTVAAGHNVTATLKRTFNDNAWNTLVLPFDLTADQIAAAFGADAKVAAYTGATAGADGTYTLNFTEATTITANTPVFIHSAQNKANGYTFTGVEVKDATPTQTADGFNFVGTYTATTVPVGNYFINSSNKFYKAGDDKTNIKGTRATFEPVGAATSAKGLGFNVTEDGTTTAINSITMQEELNANAPMYNLAGQQVTKAYKGVILQNGKKFINK